MSSSIRSPDRYTGWSSAMRTLVVSARCASSRSAVTAALPFHSRLQRHRGVGRQVRGHRDAGARRGGVRDLAPAAPPPAPPPRPAGAAPHGGGPAPPPAEPRTADSVVHNG